MTEEGAQAPTTKAATTEEKTCTACGSEIPRTGIFCPNCGTPTPGGAPPYPLAGRTWTGQPAYYQRPTTPKRAVFKCIAAVIIVTFAIVVILELVALVYGASLVGPDIFNQRWSYPLFVITPYIVEFASLSGYALLGYYIFLIAAIVMSASWVLLTSLSGFRKELEVKAKSKDHSALFDVGALTFATLFFSIVVVLLFGISGAGPSTGSLSRTLLALSSASVWEELVSRVLLIGVPLLVFHLIRRKRLAWHRYLLGSKFGLGVPETVLIVVSGLMFGIAHYEGGWGLWKIAPAAVAGFAFGYLFLRHGLAAAVLMHFGTDYLTMPGDVFNSIGLTGIIGIMDLLWAGAGAVFFTYFVFRVVEFFSGKDFLQPRERQPTTVPWGYGYAQPNATQSLPPQAPVPPVQYSTQQPAQQVSYGAPVGHGFGVGYVCPFCGSREARWADGRFQCLRCGRLS